MSAKAVIRRVLITIVIIVLAIVVLGVIALHLEGLAIVSFFIPVPSPEEAYPHAPPMPVVVSTPIDDLLLQYEAFLKTKAPGVFSALQPGLADSQIDAIESKYSVNLPPNLRALYRWRDGTPRTAGVDTFPDHEFVPLEDALANRDEHHRQVKANTPEQQQAYTAYAGHRNSWIGLIADPAGDGYFFDPERSESQGSFFYRLAEDGDYVFYPAFRNYLAAVLDGEKSRVFVAGKHGVETADFLKAQDLWCRYGAQPAR